MNTTLAPVAFRTARRSPPVEGRATAGGLLHDLNNLFLVIRTGSELIRNQVVHPHETGPLLDQIRRASLQAGRLLQDLEGADAAAEVHDAGEVVRNCLPVLQGLLGTRHQLRVELEEDSCPLRLRPGQLERILANLTVNAREAMIRPGTLTLRTTRTFLEGGYHLDLEIADDGPGIPPAILARLFQPGNSTRSPRRGQGLVIVRDLVEEAAGTIEVETSRQGTTFRIRIPLTSDRLHSRTCEMPNPTPSNASHESHTVLLVEDEPLVRSIFSRILRGAGYFVIEAATPTEALILAEHFSLPIHLLLADLSLPRLNGVELARKMEDLHPETRVLLLSGYGGGLIPGQLETPPPYPFLQKPCTSEALIRKIREVLDHAEDAALKDTVHDLPR